MLTKIAWKNIWRNPVRSLILIIAIALGIWALVFINAVSVGMVNGYVQNAVQNRTSHIQIHSPAYENEKEIGHFFSTSDVDSYLDQAKFVKGYTQRIIVSGMINSPKSSRGIILYGISPEKENEITHLNSKIVQGDSLSVDIRNALLISTDMAEKLGVDVHSKVVINFQNTAGEVTAAAFRIAGILRNTAGKADDANAYVKRDVLQKLTGLKQDKAHEIAILINDINQLSSDQERIQTSFPNLSVKTYKEISPDVALMESQINITLTVMTVIFMLALIFGIINTMLMAVLERYKELGMLLAVGMKKMQVFKMVVIETVFLSMVGVPVGLLLGRLTIGLTQHYGINLQHWAEGLEEFGLLTTIYPSLSTRHYIIIAMAVIITALLASIYPARKATSLNPIQALRKI